ncbi:hypothetical protein NEOLEDRAFT_974650 [Neolentinus lepideus HHB14362 ss-1]|uniref:Uncharacterized protein n=1 Tax=Neolentinus lepideus HHB14362 ss-1 TaxID=1314782 RepID=A0A165NAI6_9AGAM|nr:hypothetical protein NEOLEDRAFT_974650 [Neolentinus lepideus HHB14362 ss-1]
MRSLRLRPLPTQASRCSRFDDARSNTGPDHAYHGRRAETFPSWLPGQNFRCLLRDLESPRPQAVLFVPTFNTTLLQCHPPRLQDYLPGNKLAPPLQRQNFDTPWDGYLLVARPFCERAESAGSSGAPHDMYVSELHRVTLLSEYTARTPWVSHLSCVRPSRRVVSPFRRKLDYSTHLCAARHPTWDYSDTGMSNSTNTNTDCSGRYDGPS